MCLFDVIRTFIGPVSLAIQRGAKKTSPRGREPQPPLGRVDEIISCTDPAHQTYP
jgi:hypothetical protein